MRITKQQHEFKPDLLDDPSLHLCIRTAPVILGRDATRGCTRVRGHDEGLVARLTLSVVHLPSLAGHHKAMLYRPDARVDWSDRDVGMAQIDGVVDFRGTRQKGFVGVRCSHATRHPLARRLIINDKIRGRLLG